MDLALYQELQFYYTILGGICKGLFHARQLLADHMAMAFPLLRGSVADHKATQLTMSQRVAIASCSSV